MFIFRQFLEDIADILAAFLSKSYCASFCLIFLSKILSDQLLSFYKIETIFFLNLKESLAGNVVSVVKKEYGSFVHSLYIFTKSI